VAYRLLTAESGVRTRKLNTGDSLHGFKMADVGFEEFTGFFWNSF